MDIIFATAAENGGTTWPDAIVVIVALVVAAYVITRPFS